MRTNENSFIESTSEALKIGKISTLILFFLLLAYAIITLLGFLSLKSPSDPIADPYFTLMELLILIIAPLMVIVLVAIDAYANDQVKIYSKIALIFMILMTTITSSVHILVLILSRQNEVINSSWGAIFFSFNWPSAVYVLDILAWDWFFALSFIFASKVFGTTRLEKTVKILMLTSGILSLIGLLGVPLNNMQIRNIGIVGYSLVTLPVFLLLFKIFSLAQIKRIDKY